MSGIVEDPADLSDSDSNDEDYCPSAGEESEDQPESDNEELGDENVDEDVDNTKPRKKKQKNKRQALDKSEDEEIKEVKQVFSKEEQKKHADSLWADFLQDVGTIPKNTPLNVSRGVQKINSEGNSSNNSKSTDNSQSSNSKITVTEEYEFAGEKVLVTKEVSENSKEAKTFNEVLSKNEKVDVKNTDKPESTSPPAVSGGVKRTSGLDNILGKIVGKKQKINTLEKSLFDWKKFKTEEGIEEELQQHNRGKEGYLDRQAFLQRTDLRQFEIERNLRMTNRSNR